MTHPKTALITGVTGQDGAYLAEFLLKKGIDRHRRGALGARRADVVLAHHLEHRRAGEPHDQRRTSETHDRGGDRQQSHLLQEAARLVGIDRDGAEPVHRRHQHQEAEPERRQRQAAEADDAQRVVEAGVLAHRADDAERHADQHRDDQRHAGELGADRDARRDLLDRRPLRDVGEAQIAARQAADPLAVLLDDRQVEAELLGDLGLLLGIGDAGGIDQDVGDVARHQPQHDEDQHRHAEQGERHQQQASDEVGAH